MTEQELEELFRELEAQGWHPELCDTVVHDLGITVPAGRPAQMGDIDYDPESHMLFPRRLAGNNPMVTIDVVGDSMIDAGMYHGDKLVVALCDWVESGDIVVADMDGEFTVKVYYEDEKGGAWLVPRNEAYKPIAITSEMRLHIYGVVRQVLHKPEYCPLAELQSLVQRVAPKQGRPGSRRLEECFSANVNARQCIERMRPLLEGQKGKRVALVVHCAMEVGWLMEEPSFPQLVEEFGPLGSKQAYRNQFNCRDFFTRQECEPIIKELRK